jgi:site-specific DNA recombinase
MQRKTRSRDRGDLSDQRLGVYLRVSRADEEDKQQLEAERSTSTQRRIAAEWAARAGVQIAGEYPDPDMSASRFAVKKHRPEFERMVADVEAGKLDLLWFWEISRQQRRLDVFARLRDVCREHGAAWIIRDRLYDPRNSGDMLQLGIQSMIAEDETEKLSIRLIDGKKSAALAGKRAGKIAYGYRAHYDPATGKPDYDEIDPVTAPIVREIYDRLYRGESLYAIHRDLNARGIPTPRGGHLWDSSAVRSIATNAAYIRLRVHQGEGIPRTDRVRHAIDGVLGNWPALVDENVWWAVHEKLSNPGRKKTQPHRPGGRLLSAVARCGACGEPLSVSHTRGVPRNYVCRVRTCCAASLDDFEMYVTRIMIAWLTDQGTKAALAAAAAQADSEVAKVARADLARAEARLADLHADALLGDLPDDYAPAVKGQRAVIAKAKERLAAAQLPPILQGAVLGPEAEAGWWVMSVPQRRQLIAAVADIRLHPVGKRGGDHIPVPLDARVEWRWLLGDGNGQGAGQTAEQVREKLAALDAAGQQRAADRLARVARMRADGIPGQDMAAELGVSVSMVQRLVREAKTQGLMPAPGSAMLAGSKREPGRR